MNWDAIIAITEVVGVAGLIATLIYVAIQIKQNAAIARANIVHGTTNSWASYYGMLAQNSELADIHRRGRKGEPLTETEEIQYEALIETCIVLLEDLDHQWKFDLYFDDEDDEHVVDYIADAYKPLLYSPTGQNWWKNVAPHSTTPSLYKRMSYIMARWDQDAEN